MWVVLAVTLIGLQLIRRFFVDADLLEERKKGTGNDVRTGLLILLFLLIAALDGWFHWTHVGCQLQIAALVVFVIGAALNTGAMIVNPFFSSIVRLQPDRHQHVITKGPYQLVRHPGNLGNILAYLASGLVLGSWLATIIGLFGAILMVLRVSKEDQLLLTGLPGYRDYAKKVPRRLVPGIW